MKTYITLVLFFIGIVSYSQYTEVINSKRPGFSESPFGVGTKVYQIESGLFYQYDGDPSLLNVKKSRGIDIFLRSGFIWEKFELSINLKLQKDDLIQNALTGNTNSIGGINQFTIGAKYLFYMPKYKDPSKEIRSWKRKIAYDWKRLIPSVGLYVGYNTNLLSSDYKAISSSPKVAILLQNDFSNRLILVTNIIGDYLTLKDKRTFGYIATLTYSITPKFSFFGEHQGMFSSNSKKMDFGGGIAYLINKDYQLGLNIRTDSQFEYLNIYGAVGLSYRIDRHKDKLIREKPSKDGSGRVQYKRESFFKRLFSRKGRREKKPRISKARKTRKKKVKKARKPRKSRKSRRSRRSRRN